MTEFDENKISFAVHNFEKINREKYSVQIMKMKRQIELLNARDVISCSQKIRSTENSLNVFIIK